jgi:hypothetical protein
MDRRMLIKAAAIAGAGAWAAPAILGSVASPAAAQSGAVSGDFLFTFLVTYSTTGCTAVLQPATCAFANSIPDCPGAPTPVYPTDALAGTVTATFSNCVSLNQGVCWTTSQGNFKSYTFTASGDCNSSAPGFCGDATVNTCGGGGTTNTQLPASFDNTVNNGQTSVIQLVVTI